MAIPLLDLKRQYADIEDEIREALDRVVASQGFRVKKVAEQFDLPLKEAERRVMKTDADRRAFVRKYFYADIADPRNYDLVINTENIAIAEAIEGVCHILTLKSGAAPKAP